MDRSRSSCSVAVSIAILTGVLAGCGAPTTAPTVSSDGPSTPADGVATIGSALHGLFTPPAACLAQTEARVPAMAGAIGPGYGNWCGQNVSGPGAPINCWDAACQVHDYAYGRWQDGYASCHSVTLEHGMFDTQCTQAADAAICAQWTDCNGQYDHAAATWHWVGVPNGNGRGNHQERICNANPPHGLPAQPGRRVPTWCGWLNNWTCEDALPCPSPPTFVAPDTNCGIPIAGANQAALETAAAAMAASVEGVRTCCSDYPLEERLAEPQCCVPTTCAAEGANCGDISDGCGGGLNCGTCASPQSCGGGGSQNRCGCTPTTCSAAGAMCGSISDGCGGTLDCGLCALPQTCGGGGVANQCGCTPATCASLEAGCGTIADGCGGTADCGPCVAPQTCGGGGVHNQCGCTPTICAAAGANCGTVSDGCGGALDCGTCTAPDVCGSAGIPNQCATPSVVHFDCGGPDAMDVGSTISCTLPSGPHTVIAVYTSVGCNDGETGDYTLSFDDGSTANYGAACGTAFGVGAHLTTTMSLTMNSGGGPDNHISFECCGSGGWQVDYR